MNRSINTDILVIGSGILGTTAAIISLTLEPITSWEIRNNCFAQTICTERTFKHVNPWINTINALYV